MEDVTDFIGPTTDDDNTTNDGMRVEYIIEDEDVKDQQEDRQGAKEIYLGALNSPSTSSEDGHPTPQPHAPYNTQKNCTNNKTNNNSTNNSSNSNNNSSSNRSNRYSKSSRPGRKTDRQRMESGQRREWTDAEIVELIQLWRENDILYNTNHPLYYVQAERKLALDTITSQLQISLKDVSDKMHSLRTYYCSQRQRLENVNAGHGERAGAGGQVSRWKFYDQMSFLYESVTNRAVKSSMTGKSRRKNHAPAPATVVKTEPSDHTSVASSSSSSYELQEVGTDSHARAYDVGKTSPVRTYQVGRDSPLAHYEVSKTSPLSAYEDGKTSPLSVYEVGKSPPMRAYEAVYTVPYEDSLSIVGQSDSEQHHIAISPDYRTPTNEQTNNRILIDENTSGKRRLIEAPVFYPIPEPIAQPQITIRLKPEASSGSSKSDTIFGEMVADSLSQIEDEQQKELLKLNIQTLIYNVRFRRNNATTQ